MPKTSAARATRGARGGPRREAVRDPEGTRKALLKSAVTLFERHGYSATPVQQIVDEAGLTKGAFYHHFESKEDLLLELHDEFIDYQLERAQAVLGRDEPPGERLEQFVTEVAMEPLTLYKAEIAVFLQEYRFLSEEAFAEIKVKRDRYAKLVVDLIQEGIDRGAFKDIGPPQLLAFGVIGISAWAHTWLDLDGAYSPTEIGRMFGRMLVEGLAASPAGTS